MIDDCQLLARLAQRDAAALETLIERHGDSLRRQIVAIVRDPAAADDLLQELFLRVWTRAGQFAGTGSVLGWMSRSAAHLALNYLRTVRRRRSTPLEPPGDDALAPAWLIDDEAETPEQLAMLAERAAEVRARLDTLDDQQREMLRLIYDAGAGPAEVARQLGIPPGTAKSRLHYTRRRLQREWHDLGQDLNDAND